MSFEKYDGSSRGRKVTHQPGVKMWASGKIAFNEAAVDDWFGDAEYVALFTHSTEPWVGFAATTEEHAGETNVYVLHTTGSYTGKLLQVKKLLRDLECTRPDESLSLDAEFDAEEGMVIVDFDPLT
ncbi:hypothetical protein HUG10_21285 (plasmid) [Halorarum halophilum]|uniref:Uncharacterized protein n=1 Tax=Halorarum halophilum TaxID=2743090 RepID=A0A7D5L340_9EURY|nr:hypothetical protein [Halobaculum halophilum]QLG30123.1 hypothetical protein HUG10_21285 [Halobaculum halophilum]